MNCYYEGMEPTGSPLHDMHNQTLEYSNPDPTQPKEPCCVGSQECVERVECRADRVHGSCAQPQMHKKVLITHTTTCTHKNAQS